MHIQLLSPKNLNHLTDLSLALWPDSNYGELLAEWEKLIHSNDDFCALAKSADDYIGFIHISLRHDYVEGANHDRTAYLEGIYIKPANRHQHIATLLLSHGEQWAKSKGVSQLGSDTPIANQDSQEFHKKSGFTEQCRMVCYMKNI